MRGMKVRGGHTAAILYTKRNAPYLSFSKTITEILEKAGFRYAKIFYEQRRLRLLFTFEPDGNAKPLRFNKSPRRATLTLKNSFLKESLPYFFSSDRLPISQRKASVSLRGNEAFINFPFGFDLNPSFALPKEISALKLLGPCYLYINSRRGFCYLYFNSEVAQWFERAKIRGLQLAIQPPLLFAAPEKDCFFECQNCPRVDCLPLSFTKNKKQARISLRSFFKRVGFLAEQLNSLTEEEKRGGVFLTAQSLLLIKLSFLKTPPKSGALFFLIFG